MSNPINVDRHIYLRENGTYYVRVPFAKGKGSALSATCKSLASARAKRTELEAVREARSTAKPKTTTINPRWAVRVRLLNGSETVRHYTARHPTAAADCACKRADVMLVLGVPSLSPTPESQTKTTPC